MKLVVASKDVTIPEGVKIEVKARKIRVKGPRGERHSDSRMTTADTSQQTEVTSSQLCLLTPHSSTASI